LKKYYKTGDLKRQLEKILQNWGFKKTGRVWFNNDLDIYIDWVGSSLDEGEEAEKRLNTVFIDENLDVKIISIEDLIIDRLNAYKWWKDEDSFLWAKVLLKVKESIGEKIDVEYLKKRAKKEQIEDILMKLLKNECV